MKKLSLIFVVAVILASCDKREVELKVDPVLTSESGILGVIYDGNTSCDDLPGSYVASSGKIDFVNGSFVFEPGEGWPYGLEVTVSEDGRSISFSLPATSSYCVGAVIVKGGNASNVFTYDPGVKSDEGLSAPLNSSGSPAALSNLTFCFTECGQPELILAFKGQMFGGWSRTVGSVDYYIPFVPDKVGGDKIYWMADVTQPAGNIMVSDSDGDGLLEVTVNNNDMPAALFQYDAALFVGTVEQFIPLTSYQYPYKLTIAAPTSTLTFELPF